MKDDVRNASQPFVPDAGDYAARIREGAPFPRGATYTGSGVNFAVFSAHATGVDLCLFDEAGEHEIARIPMPEYTNEVWHVHIDGLQPGTVYGYRVHGPYDPANGHRFNPNKLLMDPYARRHLGELTWAPEIFGYELGSPEGDLSFDTRDSAPFVPKCVVVDAADTPLVPTRHRVPWDSTVFYEAHVRGMSMRHPEVPEHLRGTFAGLAQQPLVRYMKELGVTSVELLPVHSFVNDSYLLDKGLTNYWGYNSIGFFAADPRYFSRQDPSEFREMVDALHEAGLEVILDVVYNHTAEGNELGPTLSFKGIDNASYYRLMPDDRRYYINDTGTGNTLNLSHPRVMQMVTDSLRYWVQEQHVDGFRFDLATILGREDHGFEQRNGFLNACMQDPVLSAVKLIAEPWDCGPGGYQVGGFPPGWAEWNDRFRDDVRAFWKGDESMASKLATRFSASADMFNHHGRRAWSSVNFITAHDGFTLHDLVSYQDKHNEANGEDNRDGHSDNRSWNCGAEGPTEDEAINALRRRQQRNLLSTLLLAQGTPMLVAGDEFGRSQQGNNNAYCQDNDISWLQWQAIDDAGRAQQDFTRRLLALRRELGVLRRSRFLNGEYNEDLGVTDSMWIAANGETLTQEQWNDAHMKCFGIVLDGRSRESNIRRHAGDATVLVVFNSHHDVVEFTMPPVANGERWIGLIDTNVPQRPELPRFSPGEGYTVSPHSLLLFLLESDNQSGRRAEAIMTVQQA
ncbi:glycogen debranching protein GlgX [Herbaspirillum sp. LeCh32-8]|uniref:glycogen debranching protein GlgX n=1 Tax=Herbaspirillum sp. LeCh32-8 TaxID=2821356 RepID=UPI001AE9BC8D|nr:glycogen debranching protein GlgX [Herbaspirillum sp. LeCh32-8]MBP0599839.1 glycogen debranching protein GlgX [Herbaspirillum sp. LeCh32-8]